MAKITEKSRQAEDARLTSAQLICQLKSLKEIKPRKEWAILLKSQILVGSAPKKIVKVRAQQVSISNVLSSIFFQRKFAYAFALVLLLAIGFFGFTQHITVDNKAVLSQGVAALRNSVNDLATQGKTEMVINEIKASALELAKNLKAKPADLTVMKEIAVSFKTLADVTGVDLSANPDVESLYQAVVESQIADLEKSTLTDNQNEALEEIKELYNNKKYTEALEKILLIN